MSLIIGFGLAAAVGIYHHFTLRALDRLAGGVERHPDRTLIGIFMGLFAVHFSEILIYALVYKELLEFDRIGQLSGQYEGSWEDLVYFSGINFATLGFTQIEASGPIRLISMLQSLLGFMLITWSATFTYSVWQRMPK